MKECKNCKFFDKRMSLCLLFDELVKDYCRCFMHMKKNKDGGKKMINKKYYINVKEKMKPLTRPKCTLPKPKLKPKFVFDETDGIITIITVETEK